MQLEGNQSVGIELVGDAKFAINYNSPMLGDHLLDYPSTPEEERPGQMRRLLCGAAVGCFTGAVYMTMTSRGARVKSLKGTAVSSTGKDENSVDKVKAIDIRVEVNIDDADLEILEEVKKFLENGCLVTRSISPSITVTHTIVRT